MMSLATEIIEDMGGSCEGAFGADDPRHIPQGLEARSESGSLAQGGDIAKSTKSLASKASHVPPRRQLAYAQARSEGGAFPLAGPVADQLLGPQMGPDLQIAQVDAVISVILKVAAAT
jgi:hypothetical protein